MSNTQTETLINVTFINPMHLKLHDILLQYGFTFQISSSFKVGTVYTEPKKNPIVDLKYVEDEEDNKRYGFDIIVSKGTHTFTTADYTEVEWTWLTEVNDDEIMLERELHIQCKVRPNILHKMLNN
jgi:hypothetical protein